MASLTLPEGKTAADMRAELKAKAVAANSSGMDSTSAQSNADGTQEKGEQEPTAPSGSRQIRWKEADKRIQALRKVAQESGKRYAERVAGGDGKHPVVWRS